MRKFCFRVCLACVAFNPIQTVLAQEQRPLADAFVSSVFIINSQRVFSETRYGRRLARELAQSVQTLQAENDAIVQELSQEEASLTEARGTLSSEVFRQKAEEFHKKAQNIRFERQEMSADIELRRRREQAVFEREIAPVVQKVMQLRGVTILQEQSTTYMSLKSVDLTDDIISAIDSVLGDGSVRVQDITPPE